MVLCLALALAGQLATASRGLASQEDEWDGLPAGEGREEVYGICGACHSLMIVKQQGLDRAAWEESLVWMVEEQGMPELDEETLDRVLDYLAQNYGVDGHEGAARP